MKRLLVPFLATLFFASAFAQDTTYSDYNIVPEQLWYLQTPVWIAGGVVILLLLIAIFRGRKRKHPKGIKLIDGKFTVKKIRKEL